LFNLSFTTLQPPPRLQEDFRFLCPEAHSNTPTPPTTNKNLLNHAKTTITAAKFTNNPPNNANFSNPNRTDKRTEQRQDFQRINALLVKMYVYAAKLALLPAAETQLRRN